MWSHFEENIHFTEWPGLSKESDFHSRKWTEMCFRAKPRLGMVNGQAGEDEPKFLRSYNATA